VTLPVEFDASRRAKEQLLRLGLIANREHAGVSRVLSAAAMTYVAAMVSSVMTLLHLFLIARAAIAIDAGAMNSSWVAAALGKLKRKEPPD